MVFALYQAPINNLSLVADYVLSKMVAPMGQVYHPTSSSYNVMWTLFQELGAMVPPLGPGYFSN